MKLPPTLLVLAATCILMETAESTGGYTIKNGFPNANTQCNGTYGETDINLNSGTSQDVQISATVSCLAIRTSGSNDDCIAFSGEIKDLKITPSGGSCFVQQASSEPAGRYNLANELNGTDENAPAQCKATYDESKVAINQGSTQPVQIIATVECSATILGNTVNCIRYRGTTMDLVIKPVGQGCIVHAKSTTTYIDSLETTTDCPSSLTYGGGSQKYRFVEHINSLPPPQYLPCTGDIDKCVYTAHRKYYCMNGNKPDYTPFELNPHHDQITPKNVSTFVGTIDESDTNSIFETGSEPLISIKLFPNDYARRLVWGGFILKTFKRGGGTTSYPVGFTDQLSYAKNTYIYLEIGEGITEVFGSYGSVIDQVTFGATPNPANSNASPTFYAVGGFNGGGFDATPSPHFNGPCYLLSIRGQTSTEFGETDPAYIKAVQFNWQCVGKPTHFVY